MSKKRRTRKEKKLYITQKQSDFLLQQSKKDEDTILSDFETWNNGLKNDQIEERRDKYGPNTIANKHKATWYKTLLQSFASPFTLILIVVACLNIIIPALAGGIQSTDWIAFGIIMVMVMLSGILKFVQDFKSSKASEKLNEMINTTAAVEREGVKKEIPIEDIVPGDIIHLAAGDMVPADMRLLYSKDLFITQSALTGESEPVEKTAAINTEITNALYCNNICFMGTTVASGSAYGVAIQTGNSTFLGKVAKAVGAKREPSSFDKGIKKISRIILITMSIMCLIIFIIKGLRNQFGGFFDFTKGNPWVSALTWSLASAIAIIPEMLPMIVTLNLSKEAIKFSKQKAIIKNVNAIQTFGAMDVLCTDKTGTLTEDHIVLQEHLNVLEKEDELVLLYGCLNSYYQTGLKNLIDKAIVERAMQKKVLEKIKGYTKVDEVPFDFERRRMSIILTDPQGERKLITKGASEEVLSICSKILIDGKVVELTDKWLTKIKKTISTLNDNGMRVICVATNHQPLLKNEAFSDEDEKDLCLVGYIALLDPPKMSAKAAITDLQAKGVQVKILTGDNEKVTKYICKELGLKVNNILLGDEIEKMDYDQLKDAVRNTTIFAKLSPEQKANIVKALKDNKHVVGFMGDGINDAPAMRAADIAISVDTAVDIAKESADVILLEKDLNILSHGALLGRKTFANIMKYIKISLSSNFGNMLSMLIAACWLPFEPLSGIQIIFMNLCYDFTQVAIPWDSVNDKFIQTPKNWKASTIIKFMLVLGPVSTIFDVSTFCVMFFFFGCNDATPDKIAMFQTGWFIEAALSQTIVIWVLRSREIGMIQTRPALPLTLSTAASSVICAAVPFIPGINYGLKFVPNLSDVQQLADHGIYWAWLFGIILGYIILAESVKKLYMVINHQEWI